MAVSFRTCGLRPAQLTKHSEVVPMEWTPPPGGIAMCQDGTERLSTI